MKIKVLFALVLLSVLMVVPATAQTKSLAAVTTANTVSGFSTCNTSRIGKYYGVIQSTGAMYQCTASGWVPMTDTAGTVPSASQTAGVTSVEAGSTVYHKTVYTFTNVSVTMTDATTAGNHGGIQLYDFPAGLVSIVGATSDLQILAGAGGIDDAAAVVCSFGSVVVQTDNSTLTTTEADFIPSTAAGLTAGAGNCDGESTTPALFNGTATAIDGFLNFAVPDAGSTASDTLTVNGTLTLVWIQLGDN